MSDSTVPGAILNPGSLRGVGSGLSMLRTLVESISPQTVNSRRELEAFQSLPRHIRFPGIFSSNTGPAPICVSSAGRVRKGLPVDQSRRRGVTSRSRQWRWQLKLKLNSGCCKEGVFE